MNTDVKTVGHFVSSYLFQTGNWIYTQLTNMKSYKPFVLTSAVENLNQFPIDHIYCYNQLVTGGRLWQIAARKAYEGLTHAQARYYTNIIKTLKTQLLHAHFGTEGYYHLGVQQKADLPLITTFYGADVSKLPQYQPKWQKRYGRLFEVGSLFLAEGPYMAQAIVDLGCPSQKVRVQHLGVDVNRIPFTPRYRVDREPVRFMMACSFREKKGIPYGIEAFARACRKFPDMQLRIIGGAKTHSERIFMERCKTIVKKEGVVDRVSFLGYIPYSDYLNEVNSAHIFLAPSVRAGDGDTEGGAPVSVIEASAAGIPVIASRHCDIPNVIIDGKTGILVPEKDVDLLGEAILSMASTPEIWPVMGKLGRDRVETYFDVFRQVERLERIYDEFDGGSVN